MKAARATTVEPTASTAMETAATATAVETSTTSAAVTSAMLSEHGHWQANERERSKRCKKSLEQGGFPHMNTPPPKPAVDNPGGQTACINPTSIWNPIPSRKLSLRDTK